MPTTSHAVEANVLAAAPGGLLLLGYVAVSVLAGSLLVARRDVT